MLYIPENMHTVFVVVCFVVFCFVLFCFVLFCFVLFCFVVVILYVLVESIAPFSRIVQGGVTSLLTGSVQIARFMGPTWGPPGVDRAQVGPRWATWALLSGIVRLPHCRWRKPEGYGWKQATLNNNKTKQSVRVHIILGRTVRCNLMLCWISHCYGIVRGSMIAF